MTIFDKEREAVVEWLRNQQKYNTARHIVTMCNGQQFKRGDLYKMAADVIEGMAAELEQVKRERAELMKYIHGRCAMCSHKHCGINEEPCASCTWRENRPGWEWDGEAVKP